MNIRVLREAGGVGDVVRILPAIRGLREKYPDARIDVFAPKYYQCIVRRGGCATNIYNAPCTEGKRRSRLADPDEERWPYMETGIKYDLTIDLYCPAFAYELKNGRNVWHDRTELFCMAAEVQPSDMRPAMALAPAEKDAARDLLRQHEIARRKGWVAIQPFSTDGGRDWPKENWKTLADALSNAGYGVFALDSCNRPKDFPCPQLTGKPLIHVAAVLSIVRVLIGPDSGLLHLAAAVGGAGIGLTASQSGAVLYRHYPRHTYIQPDNEDVCQWPCFWKRGRKCARRNYAERGDTCYALATLKPATVIKAALNHLESDSGDQRLPVTPPVGPSSGPRGVAFCRGVIPARDRSIGHLELAQSSDISLPQALKEHFRVLIKGGTLHAMNSILPLARSHGFTLLRRGPTHSLLQKTHTWPKLETRD